MKILNSQDRDFSVSLENLINIPDDHKRSTSDSVKAIIREVVKNKNSALLKFTQKFDCLELKSHELLLSEAEINFSLAQVSEKQKQALDLAAKRIHLFHQEQLPEDKFWVDKTGVEIGWRWQPIERIGLYVPGGTASYPSSVLMNAIPAKIAGAKEIVMVSPTPNGKINPLVIYAATISGVDKVYRIGGAQAVAALSYGTETIQPVDKIIGPGNEYVAEAKRQVFGRVGIDMIAGPSEVVIIADGNNNAEWISADLLSQAEHDASAQSILITTNQSLASEVLGCLPDQLAGLGRKKIAAKSWENNGVIIVVENLDQAARISNRFAPEHLQLCVNNPEMLLKSITNAGSIFLGPWTPEALGDYIIGPNHILPTERSAKFSSGLSVLDFMKRSFVSKVSSVSFKNIGESASILANAEGLGAHKLSVDLRGASLTRINKNDQK